MPTCGWILAALHANLVCLLHHSEDCSKRLSPLSLALHTHCLKICALHLKCKVCLHFSSTSRVGMRGERQTAHRLCSVQGGRMP
jgi:hypothetical protein